jgi:predicted enzyme related to lactoylglutathione lyase
MLRAMTNIGRVVWYELLTSDPKGAVAFYTETIGWKTQQWGNDYTMWVTGQGPIGGVTQLPAQAKAMGAPPYWQGSIQVESVDLTCELVKKLGGKIYVTEDVPDVGRLAVIADPQGAVVSVFTPKGEMAPHDLAKDGEVSWHELYTTDHRGAFEFYRQIAGWEQLGTFDMGPMGEYLLWGRNGKQLGGMMTMPKEMKQPPGWMYYVTTSDLDGTLAKAKAKGAKVLNGPMEVPGGQRIVQLADPQGAVFALVTPPKG